MESLASEYKKIDGQYKGDIKMFALSTCGWCKKTKAFLKDHDIAFSYVDVDLLPEDEQEEALKEQRKYNPAGSFPTIVVDSNDVIVGYDLNELNELMAG